jgi:hypothetical protein
MCRTRSSSVEDALAATQADLNRILRDSQENEGRRMNADSASRCVSFSCLHSPVC